MVDPQATTETNSRAHEPSTVGVAAAVSINPPTADPDSHQPHPPTSPTDSLTKVSIETSSQLEKRIDLRPAKRFTNAPQDNSLRLWLQRYPLVFYFLAWIIGASLAQWQALNGISVFLAAIAAVLLALCTSRYSKNRKWISSVAVFLSIVPVACLYTLATKPAENDSLSLIADRKSQSIALRGIISDAAVWSPNPWYRESDPNSEPWATKWRVQWEHLRDKDQWIAIQASSSLSTDGRIDNLLPGDRIQVFGTVELISPPTNPGAPNFADLARSKGTFVTVNTDDCTQIQLLEDSNRFWFSRMRGIAVRAIDRALHNSISFDQAELAAALVFGQREQVDWDSQQQLMATGTLHMLAISGMHVEIIAMTLLLVCQLLSLRRGVIAVVVIGVCSLYAGLAGSNPPVMRALILIVAFTLARYWGLAPRLMNLLALAAILLAIQNSSNLTNVGVQLSFIAVATIGIFNRSDQSQRRDALQSLLEQQLPWWRRILIAARHNAVSALRISFWVGMLTTPLIWHSFHVVSIVSIPLNVLLSFPLMVGLLFGLLTGIVDLIPWIGGAASSLTGAVSGLCLELIQDAVELAYRLPCGHLWLPSPPLWWTAGFYATALVWLLVLGLRYRGALAICLSLWVVVGVGLFATGPRGYVAATNSSQTLATATDAKLQATFIDVGHGTSVILELPDGRVWLYDAGHMGIQNRSHEVIANTLWSLPTARIDTLIISHADSDHYNATAGLVKRFNVGRVVSTKRFWQSTAREVTAMHEAIWKSGIQYESWNSQTPETEITQTSLATSANSAGRINTTNAAAVSAAVLHPPPNFRAETDNADSLTLQIEFAGVRLLLPGDIEGSGILALCEQPPRQCKILMAPHHGSLSHDPAPLLEWCTPQTVVVSGNQRAARPEVLARYADAECTAVTHLHGAVRVIIDSQGSVINLHWNQNRWQPLTE